MMKALGDLFEREVGTGAEQVTQGGAIGLPLSFHEQWSS